MLEWLPAATKIASTVGSYFSGKSAQKRQDAMAERQIALQREFAQSGIQWKVADAKKAGIHPLYALGAQTTSFQPISVGSSSTDFSGLASAGQDIGRAIDSTRGSGERATALQQSIAAAQLDGIKIDNDIKRAELASKLATNTVRGPGMPTGVPDTAFDGQGDAIRLKNEGIKIESKRDVTDPTRPPFVPGSGPSVAFMKNATGGWSPVIPPELAESLESDKVGAWDWIIRNRVLPNLSDNVSTPNIPRKADEEVYWDWRSQDYRIRKKRYGPHEKEGKAWWKRPFF